MTERNVFQMRLRLEGLNKNVQIQLLKNLETSLSSSTRVLSSSTTHSSVIDDSIEKSLQNYWPILNLSNIIGMAKGTRF